MPDLEEYGKGEICTSDPFLAPQCQPAVPCGNNQERLLNYTCADKCINGYRPDDSDDCIPRIVTTSTTDISPPENSTKEPSSTPSSSSLTTTLSLTLTTSKQSSFPVPKSTTAHNLVLNPTDNSYKGPSDTVLFVVIGVLGAAVLVLLAIVIYYKCTKRKNGSGRQSNNNGDALLLEDTKASYEVRILVKQDWDFTAIDRAGPNIGSLEITQKLQQALQRELSSIPDILNVEVRDIRKGSLLVIYSIETKAEFKKSDLHARLNKISRKGNMGEFPVGHIRIIPSSRRESIIDITGETEGRFERRRSFKRSHSQMSTMSLSPSSSQLANGHAKSFPKAVPEDLEEAEPEETEPFLVADDSGYTSPQKGELSYISEAGKTPRFDLGDTSHTTSTDPSFSHQNENNTPYKKNSDNKYRSLGAYPKQTMNKNDINVNNGVCFTSTKGEHVNSLDRKKFNTKNSQSKSIEKQQSKGSFSRMRRLSSSHNDLCDPDKRDEISKTVIRRNCAKLLSILSPDRILDVFMQKEFLPVNHIRDIREKEDTSKKIRAISEAVESRGFKGYQIIYEILDSIQCEFTKYKNDFNEMSMASEADDKDKEPSDNNSSTDEENDEAF